MFSVWFSLCHNVDEKLKLLLEDTELYVQAEEPEQRQDTGVFDRFADTQDILKFMQQSGIKCVQEWVLCLSFISKFDLSLLTIVSSLLCLSESISSSSFPLYPLSLSLHLSLHLPLSLYTFLSLSLSTSLSLSLSTSSSLSLLFDRAAASLGKISDRHSRSCHQCHHRKQVSWRSRPATHTDFISIYRCFTQRFLAKYRFFSLK